MTQAASTVPGRTPTLARDALGGAIAALFTIPAAMAFGALVVAPLGAGHLVDGVVMGLTGAAVAGLLAGLAGNRSLGLTAPGGQLAVLLASAVAAVAAQEIAVPPVLAVGSAALIAGVVQIACGLLRCGRLVAYLPYPVVAGCGTGAAAVIVLSQAPALVGQGVGAGLGSLFTAWNPGAVAAGGAAIVASLLARRWWPRLPEVVPGLLAGCLAHWGLAQLGADYLGPTVGRVPTVVPMIDGLAAAGAVEGSALLRMLGTVAPIAIAAGVLGSIVSLVASAIIEGQSGQRRDGNRELLAQGLGNIGAGCSGGLPGSLSESRSLLAWRSGAQGRVAAISHALLEYCWFCEIPVRRPA